METIEFKNKVNKLQIIPLHGNDVFYIGMPLQDLNTILWNHYALYGEQNNYGYCLFYHIQLANSIRISLDIIKQQVYRIEFLREYKGFYYSIGIGSTIKELCDLRNDIFFDEQYVLVGKYPYDFIIEIDNLDNTIYNLSDVYSNRITKIIVENKVFRNDK
ncbi:hypothetical protein V3Q90_15965 [Flavobacterium oreochromis]|uniref:IPExxxVDY family protein n=1 Tax=Flavobacterium oreochromis TaxID=2906078 RepID=A0ABW8PCP8_9FLAO|nr:hypothetical protein [Flavobacterium oreochromis]OWP73951.1 hypothetical protein BWG23_15395 [Flavobacterium oreochromis]POR18834.1 hypothetical protein BWK58_14515 [Flavobacterium columnare]